MNKFVELNNEEISNVSGGMSQNAAMWGSIALYTFAVIGVWSVIQKFLHYTVYKPVKKEMEEIKEMKEKIETLESVALRIENDRFETQFNCMGRCFKACLNKAETGR